MNEDNNLSISKKKDFDKNIGTHWKRYKNRGSTFILIVLILPPNDNGNKFQQSRSFFRVNKREKIGSVKMFKIMCNPNS